MDNDLSSGESITDEDTPSRGIQSVEIAGHVLGVLCSSARAVTLKDMSAAAGMSPSKLHRYMASLVRVGLATQTESGRYGLGPMALRLGVAAIGQLDSIGVAEQATGRLAAELGLSAHLSVWGDWGPVVIRLHQGASPVLSTIRLGSVLPLARSATGLVYLAFGNSAVTGPALEREFAGHATPVNRHGLAEATRATRSQGFGTADGTVIPGLQAISCPVFDFQGDLTCAISVIGTDHAMLDPGGPCVRSLRRTSAEVGALIGAPTNLVDKR